MSLNRPCGNDPYDKEYGVGVSSIGDTFSPYERTNQLLTMIHDTPYTVDDQRAVLVTEAYQKYRSDPQIIKVAKTLKYVWRM